MFIKQVLPVAVLLLLIPAVSFGQTNVYQRGTQEFTITGSGSSDEEIDNTFLALNVSYGKFMDQNLEWVIKQEITFNDVAGASDFNGSTRGGVDYHFGSGPMVPLVGITVGYIYGDNIDEQFTLGPDVGVKYFVNDTTFVYGLIEYEILFDDAEEVDEVYDDGRFIYGVGLGFTF